MSDPRLIPYWLLDAVSYAIVDRLEDLYLDDLVDRATIRMIYKFLADVGLPGLRTSVERQRYAHKRYPKHKSKILVWRRRGRKIVGAYISTPEQLQLKETIRVRLNETKTVPKPTPIWGKHRLYLLYLERASAASTSALSFTKWKRTKYHV